MLRLILFDEILPENIHNIIITKNYTRKTMTDKSLYANAQSIKALTLGTDVNYRSQYTPELLQPVPRSLNREQIGVNGQNLPFTGEDIWNGYELSWLNPKGLPQVAVLRCSVPVTSPNIIESKSFKLYLNSLNQTVFNDYDSLSTTIENDLSQCAGERVNVDIIHPKQFINEQFIITDWQCIDDQDIQIDEYQPNPSLLKTTSHENVTQALYSNLLKSNCLVTDQPDWATLFIKYSGQQICSESLLRYIVSFREHSEFHEQCVERIFKDIIQQTGVSKLTVYARYTRRGGLDINPFRSNFETSYGDWRLVRQ